MKRIVLLCMLALLCCSCERILYSVWGIQKLSSFDPVKVEQMTDEFTKLHPGLITHAANKDEFDKYVNGFGELSKHDLSQPIQIQYFQGDSLLSFHINCYAKGTLIGKLKWNYDGKFDQYIPKSAVEIMPNKGLGFLLDDFGIVPDLDTLKPNNTIVFFWTNMLPRQSLDAFKLVIENTKKATQAPRIISINTDQFYIGMESE